LGLVGVGWLDEAVERQNTRRRYMHECVDID
jgi:hypothetical protein